MHSAISSGHTSPERPRSTTNSEQHFEQHGGRSMGPQALLELVEKIFKRFNPAQVTLDTHVDKSIAGMQVTNPHVSLESHEARLLCVAACRNVTSRGPHVHL
eukprot:1153471-Pelagomonas_calceolata.AAC.8